VKHALEEAGNAKTNGALSRSLINDIVDLSKIGISDGNGGRVTLKSHNGAGESDQGAGTTVTVELPVEPDEEDARAG